MFVCVSLAVFMQANVTSGFILMYIITYKGLKSRASRIKSENDFVTKKK